MKYLAQIIHSLVLITVPVEVWHWPSVMSRALSDAPGQLLAGSKWNGCYADVNPNFPVSNRVFVQIMFQHENITPDYKPAGLDILCIFWCI